MTGPLRDAPPQETAGDRSGGGPRAWATWAFAAGCFVFFFATCAAMFGFTAEDAFIVARYAENLVRGEGLVFNPGERINALTCPLMAILEAGIYALVGSTIVPTKLLSIALVAAAHLVCLGRLRHDRESIWLYSLLAVASPFPAFWAIGGMETPLLLWLVTAAALAYLRIVDRGISRASAAGVSVLLALLFLTRYDAILFAAPLGLALVVRHPRQAGWLLGPAVLIAGGWLVFAQLYYHDVLPTSFYIKKPIWRSYEVKRTALYLGQFAAFSGWGLLAVWTAGLLAGGGQSAPAAAGGYAAARQHFRRYWGLYLGLASFACYALMNATKHMMFGYRMIVPFVPAAGVVLVELYVLARGAGRPRGRRGVAAAAFGAMLAVQVLLAWQIDRVSINPGFVGEYLRWSRQSYVEGFAKALQDAAGAIRRHWREQPDSAVRPPRIHTFAAGITPYYLPEAIVYEQLVSYRHGGLVDWDRLPAAADYRIVSNELNAPAPEGDGDGQGRLVLVARYPYHFDGRWVELQVLYNPRPRPYLLPRFVDGADR